MTSKRRAGQRPSKPSSSSKRGAKRQAPVTAWGWGRRLLLLMLVAATLLAATGWWWVKRPLPLRTDSVELSVEPGMTPRDVARAWVDAGVDTSAWALYQWFRFSGQARAIRAGSFEVSAPASAYDLLAKMVAGDEVLERVRFIEGWTFRQVRAELARTPSLRQDAAALSDAELMAAIGAAGESPEGSFFPDTYTFSRGASDLAVLARAHRSMQHQIDKLWPQREPGLPLANAKDALILASIVEKETGRPSDRGTVAAVFINRLRLGMPLQTDPTVIYGLGERFDGNLRRRDLQTDGPYNTYMRRGLPPTPIAMPGRDALWAVLRPAPSKALYFVARGDGSSQFSESLAEHNRAVNKYQRGLNP